MPAEPVPPRRNRIALSDIGLGHPSVNVPSITVKPTAPLNVRKPRLSTKPSATFHEPSVFSERFVRSTESHNELKVILADPPRRRASASAAETLAVPPVPRTVSAPVVYREPGTSPRVDVSDSAEHRKNKDRKDKDCKDKDKDSESHKHEVNTTSDIIKTADMAATLADHTATLNTLVSTVGEIKAAQVSSEDVVGGIKKVIEYFQTARAEDRAHVGETVGARVNGLAQQVTDLLNAQSSEIGVLKHVIKALREEREQHTKENRKLLEAATSRLDRLEDFFMEENRLLAEENAHLLAHLEEASAEISELRQGAARNEESAAEAATAVETTDGAEAPAPATPARKTPPKTPHKSHRRTPSTPNTPVLPGMYPRVAALRREAIENNFLRARGANAPHVPSLPAIVPQSPFSLRFKA